MKTEFTVLSHEELELVSGGKGWLEAGADGLIKLGNEASSIICSFFDGINHKSYRGHC